MRASRLRFPLLLLLLLVGWALPAAAQDDPRPARKQELLARWQALSPAERAELRRVHAAWLADTTPEQRKALRKAVAQRNKAARGDEAQAARAKALKKLEQVPSDKKEQYRQLVQRLIKRLPAAERARLAQLPGKERRQVVQRLIREHRLRVLERHLEALPGAQRERIRADVQGLEGQERFARIRRQLHTHVRGEARGILADPQLTPAERARRLKELVKTLPPDMRQRLRDKLLAEAEKRDRADARRRLRPRKPERPATPDPQGEVKVR